jgi:hypothetical protein
MASVASAAWAAFAHTGDPSTPALPWPAYDLDRRTTILFDEQSRAESDPFRDTRRGAVLGRRIGPSHNLGLCTMKTIHAIVAIAILAGGVGVVAGAIGANAPNRPPGVSADEWAPISDTMGVVLVDQQLTAMDAPILTPSSESGAASRHFDSGAANVASGGAALIAPVSGYLMVKRGSVWQRLVVIDPIKGPGSAG